MAKNICSLKLNIQNLILPKENVFDRKTNIFAVIGADKMTDEIVMNGENYFNRSSKRQSNISIRLFSVLSSDSVSQRQGPGIPIFPPLKTWLKMADDSGSGVVWRLSGGGR